MGVFIAAKLAGSRQLQQWGGLLLVSSAFGYASSNRTDEPIFYRPGDVVKASVMGSLDTSVVGSVQLGTCRSCAEYYDEARPTCLPSPDPLDWFTRTA